ncbi:MAG: hypothetical protein UZ04_CHB001001443 [Chlorobi bacterium OLB4]|nr:MAG: UPF0104 family protein [Chlorobiota bacterium]KXK03485.1 MAG: hypothetical protein UZ04_CHB001001443 [Chlorobi bacterium OLB4]MBV6398952.1 hypothetical protein [Ignavibacteria bacterium]MCE7953860.1 UPF0104 family protein [Chlorobi bacterium CHB7]OQY77084.1 MAG: hypothetical protein B6D43_08215 [Ignavibacteriales bacterium UTCHB1]RIK47878.1 MAG: hypothetical protein DCC60_09275 [Ignavibacteriota bacterium]
MYLAFRGVEFESFINELKQTNYFVAFAGAFIGVIIGGIIRAYRWRYFLNPIKDNIKFSNLFSSMMIGYMMNSIVPKSGELSRPVILAKMENVSRASSFGTIIVERIFDMVTLISVFGICLVWYRDEISGSFGEYNLEIYAYYSGIAIILFVIAIVVMILNIRWTEKFISKLSVRFLPKKIQEKVNKILISLINGFMFIKHPGKYLPIAFLTILLWISYVVSAYVSFFAFDINLSIVDANLLLTIITFALVLPLPGNSAGAYHFFCTGTLVNIFYISKEIAFSYATVTHLLNFLFLVSIGFYYSIKTNFKLSDRF